MSFVCYNMQVYITNTHPNMRTWEADDINLRNSHNNEMPGWFHFSANNRI